MNEAVAVLEASGTALDTLRIRAFPFPDAVKEFVLAHERVFVIEQNRDAQLRSLLVNEFDLDPARLEPVLHYDGTPITARFIVREIERRTGVHDAHADGRAAEGRAADGHATGPQAVRLEQGRAAS